MILAEMFDLAVERVSERSRSLGAAMDILGGMCGLALMVGLLLAMGYFLRGAKAEEFAIPPGPNGRAFIGICLSLAGAYLANGAITLRR